IQFVQGARYCLVLMGNITRQAGAIALQVQVGVTLRAVQLGRCFIESEARRRDLHAAVQTLAQCRRHRGEGRSVSAHYSPALACIWRSRRAFAITDTELRLIASAANIGDSR